MSDSDVSEFTQLMKGLQGERLRQAFRHFDKAQTGYIAPEDFQKIIFELARHKLSDRVLETLPSLVNLTPSGKISYSEAIAFHNVRFASLLLSNSSLTQPWTAQVIREMDMVEKVVREACARSSDGKITKLDFQNHAARSMRYGTFSPMEVAIIFHYAGKGETARLGLKDFGQLLDPKWGPPKAVEKKVATGSFLHEFGKVRWTGSPDGGGALTRRSQSAYYFGLGGIAGARASFPLQFPRDRDADKPSGLQWARRRCTRSTSSRRACRTSAQKSSASCCTRTR